MFLKTQEASSIIEPENLRTLHLTGHKFKRNLYHPFFGTEAHIGYIPVNTCKIMHYALFPPRVLKTPLGYCINVNQPVRLDPKDPAQ